jgi:hypothetical protein
VSLADRLRAKSQASTYARAAALPSVSQGLSDGPTTGGINARLALKMLIAQGKEPADLSETRRVCELPLIQQLTEMESEVFNRQEINAKFYEQGFRFFGPQAEGIMAYDQNGGVFGSIAVGWGKEGLGLAIANRAFKKGVKKILLLIPSRVYDEFMRRHVPWWRSRIDLCVPIHGLGEKNQQQRQALAASDYKGLYVMTYSLLSAKDAEDILEAISPGLVIANECHALRHRGSARTRRVMDYIEKKWPEFCAWSGTITSKSIRDYHHLIRACLGNRSPLPLSARLAGDWSIVLDATQFLPTPAQMVVLEPLVFWVLRQREMGLLPEEPDRPPIEFTLEGIRRSYKHRMNTAPGVVSTGDLEIGTSLVIANKPVEDYEQAPGWDRLFQLMTQVQQEWLTPNGDEIDYSIHTYKWLYELSAGFYNDLVWPAPEVLAERRSVTVELATEQLRRSRDRHAKLQHYHVVLRRWLTTYAKRGLDTPRLVALNMTNHGSENVPKDLYDAWREVKNAEFPELVERDSIPVRVSSYKVDHMVRWASTLPKGRGAIVWVYHQEIGEWAYEALRAAGLDALHCPAGDVSNRLLIEPDRDVDLEGWRLWMGTVANKIVVASMTAHGEGKNLQAFQEQFFLQWPRNDVMAEQTLGRTHRNRQEADELVAVTCNTLKFDHLNFGACLVDACYVHQTDKRQKVVFASYDPLPKIYPSFFLKEQGFETRQLTKQQEKFMQDTFGSNGDVNA